ncbi:MAG: prenyltransferase/squalene oxidase repeat-containing protein [Candidatus Hodarchaeales archaeon]
MKIRVWILLGIMIMGTVSLMTHSYSLALNDSNPFFFSFNQENYGPYNLTQTLENESFVQTILSFISRSQDTGEEWIPSMDIAYFLASSLENLKIFENVGNDFRSEIIEFVKSTRNVDGGYGNWKNARSSMESTFQAIRIYCMYDMLSLLPLTEVNETLSFIKSLKTPLGGYFPLSDWHVPDISSTYRALWIKNEFSQYFPSLRFGNDSDVIPFLEGNFVPPFFISGSSGYSEVKGGKAELLASNDALKIYDMFNISNSHAENIAYFLRDLTSPTGGVSGYPGGTPKTGYTAVGINLYLFLDNYSSSFNLGVIVPDTFIDDAFNYIKVNKILASGFSASDRDETPEIRSTHLALSIYSILEREGLLPINPELSGIYTYLTEGISLTLVFTLL